MKIRALNTARLSFPLASAIAALLSAHVASAANLYWDVDGTTAGAGSTTPSGTWASSGTTWSTSSNGTVATVATTTAATDDLFFSAGINATGIYTITLNDSQSAQSLSFQDGTATISGASGIINLGGTGSINVPNSITASPLSAFIGASTNTLIAGSTGLTKVGVGTLTLNGTAVNTVTGGLNVNGGTLALNFANLTTPTDLINSGNALSFSNNGTLSVTGNAAGTTSQTFGNITVNSGGGSLLVNPNAGTATNIILGSLTATASGGGFVAGSALSPGAGTLTISTTSDKDATGIYGGRVVFANGTANTGYDWATTTTGSSPYTLSAYSGYTALDTATSGSITNTNNSRITAGATLPASSNRTTNSLKFENPAASQTFAISTGNTLTLTSGGLLMTGSNNDMNITGGSITAGDGSAPADLVVHQFNPAQPLSVGLTGSSLGNTPEITSNIVNNNSQAVTLVKNGPGSVRFTGTNTFTGGIIVNQGSVDFGTSSLNNNPITFNANSFFYTNGAHTTSGSITLNNSSQVTVCNNNSSFTVAGNVLGSGGMSAANGGQGAITLNLNGTANTFKGPIRFTANNGTQQATINVVSLPDTDTLGSGNITFGAGSASSTSHNFGLASTAVAPLTLNNRRFEMAGANVNQQINNASTQDLTIQPDLLVTGSQAKNLQLGGAGTGINTFAGAIANHSSPTAPGTVPNAVRKTANGNTLTLASVEGISVGATITGANLAAGTTITAIDPLTRVVTLSTTYAGGNNSTFNVGVIFTIPGVLNTVSVTKADSGTWILSGNNTYTGPTLVSVGVLNIRHANALGSTTTGTLVTSGSALQIQGGITVGNEALTLNGTGISTTGALRNISGDNTYGGLVTLGSATRINSDANTLTLDVASGNAITGTFNLTFGGAGNITVADPIATSSGTLSKADAGTLTLSGANSYTGLTTVSGGTLVGAVANAFGSTTGISIAAIGTLSLRGDASTNFVKASDSSPYSVSTSASGATINVNAVTGVTSAKTMTIGTLGTTSTENVYQVDFTGSNNTSLMMGGMTGAANASSTTPGTVTINNTIASTGTLTLASYTSANAGTGAGAGETVKFIGTGNTVVTGAITPSATVLALTKEGTGNLTLSGTSAHTGSTTISAGKLILGASGSITSSASISVAAAGTLDTTAQATYAIPAAQPVTFNIDPTSTGTSGKIAATGLDITNAVVTLNPTAALDDAVYVLATYSGTLTGAAFAAPLPTVPSGYTLQYAYQGNKIALIQNPTASYASWIDSFYTGETNPAIIGVTADPDNDGIPNGVEMVIGGDPKLGMDTALLPTLELVTDPVSSPAIPAGNYLLFTYRRSDLSVTAGVTAACETDTDLVAPWTTAVDAVSGVVIQVDDNYTFTPAAAANTDRVRVYVPRGANTTLFGHLKVQVP